MHGIEKKQGLNYVNDPSTKREYKTRSGIPLKSFYTPEDIKDLNYERDLGDPGKPPFTRGIGLKAIELGFGEFFNLLAMELYSTNVSVFSY
jgi:hypothetical protein